MNRFLYSAILCALIGWPSVQPAEGKPAQRTVHTVSGGLALASAASAVVTGLGWLYSALNERGVMSHDDQQNRPEIRTKTPLAPRAVIVGAGTKTQPANIKRPSWFTRLFLQPTTHAGTKRWRAAFIASLAAALAGGTVWGATKQKVVQKTANNADDAHSENPLVPAPRGVLPPPLPVVVPAAAPAADSDNRYEPARIIANWWREQRQRKALATARRDGARDAREALVEHFQKMTQEQQQRMQGKRLAHEAAAVASLRQVSNEKRAAEESREQAQINAADLEGQLERSDERLAAEREDRDCMIASAREEEQGAAQRGYRKNIQALQRREKELKESLAGVRAEHEAALRRIHVEATRHAQERSAEELHRLQVQVAALEAARSASLDVTRQRPTPAGLDRSPEIPTGLRPLGTPSVPAVPVGQSVPLYAVDEEGSTYDEGGTDGDDDTSAVAAEASGGEGDVGVDRPFVFERSLRRSKAKVPYRVVGTYHSLNGANIRAGDVVTVTQNDGKVLRKQRVLSVTGFDKKTAVSLSGTHITDDEFGMSGQGKRYHSIRVRRPAKKSGPRRRPQSAMGASPYSAAVPARAAARRRGRVVKATMLGQRPLSAVGTKRRPASAQ